MSGSECTAVEARWCPRCGDCSCPPYPGDLDDRRCPLHAPDSPHPRPAVSIETDEVEAILDAIEDRDGARGDRDRLRRAVQAGIELGTGHRQELAVLLGRALDAIVLGHAISGDDWERMCLLAGRYCSPHLESDLRRGELDSIADAVREENEACERALEGLPTLSLRRRGWTKYEEPISRADAIAAIRDRRSDEGHR